VIGRPREAEYSQVVGFGSSAGEYHLGSTASKKTGYGFSRSFHRCPCVLSMMMDR
jgi:hypothetical protein